MLNRVVFVGAKFKPIIQEILVDIPTGDKTRTLFGGEKDVTRKERRLVQAGWSDCQIDGARLAADVNDAVSQLNREGFEVVAVVPVESGAYSYRYQAEGVDSTPRVFTATERVSGGASFGYGYGYSYTEGVMIVAKTSSG